MKVYFVGAGPGDLELLTRKAERLLASCRCCVYAGSLVNPEILRLLPERAARYDSASMSLEEILSVFQAASQADVDVVRLHSGDPAIYSAMGEQIRGLRRLSIPYEVVPGVSSWAAAAAVLGVELTAPEVSQTVVLSREAGRTPVPEGQELDRLAAIRATLCVFLSIHSIEDLVARLVPPYGRTCPAAVVYHASWPDQVVLRGTLANIAERTLAAGIRRSALLIVGPALSGTVTPSKLYDVHFGHGHRPARHG